MTFDQRVAKGKPYVTGFVLGLIAAPIIAFGAGWVSTTGARAEAVENARIETLAEVCSDTVHRSLASQGTDLATFRGWTNRGAREDLVATAMASIEVPDVLAGRITAGCSKSLA